MSSNRCFNSINNHIVSASDLTHSKRQKTIYTNLSDNAVSTAGPDPIKLNGSRYNQNFIVRGGGGINNACLVWAKSHELLLDLTKGKRLSNPVLDGGSSATDELWGGNVLEIDYNANGIIPVQDMGGNENHIISPDAECVDPNFTIDPSQNMFYPSCNTPFIKAVSNIAFRNTNYYWKAVNANLLNGIRYPAPLRIGPQLTNTTTTIYENYAPEPISDTVDDDWCNGKYAIK